eukprot:3771659-Pleurochrysis_carterae.AAC.1
MMQTVRDMKKSLDEEKRNFLRDRDAALERQPPVIVAAPSQPRGEHGSPHASRGRDHHRDHGQHGRH